MIYIFLPFLLAVIAGYGVSFGFRLVQQNKANKQKNLILSKATQKAEKHLLESQDFSSKIKARIESLQKTHEDNMLVLEQRVALKEQALQSRSTKCNAQESKLTKIEDAITGYKISLAQNREILQDTLSTKAKISIGEAKEQLFADLDNEFSSYFEMSGNRYVENVKENTNKEAIHHLKSIMQKYSEPSSVDRLSKEIPVKKDIMKGKLIGRGAKNLVYLEEQTGADIIFEDEKGIITVSCFNLVIQETVRMAIEKLIRLQTITPEIIDQALEKSRAELNQKLERIGLETAKVIGIKQRDPELMQLIGRLKYRTSYGQNILYHSLEIAYFSAHMAAEIGADIQTAKIGGFFHDVGKAIDQEVGGAHDHLTKEIMEKFGFSWEEVHAAWTHHDAIPIETVEAQIVKAADAISAGRPGARTESAEMYVERIQNLEKIALETKGVKKAFALSAGREIRTILDENKIKDTEMQPIADTMAQNIEDNLAYPGKIKVNLIRVVEATDYANKNKKNNQTES